MAWVAVPVVVPEAYHATLAIFSATSVAVVPVVVPGALGPVARVSSPDVPDGVVAALIPAICGTPVIAPEALLLFPGVPPSPLLTPVPTVRSLPGISGAVAAALSAGITVVPGAPAIVLGAPATAPTRPAIIPGIGETIPGALTISPAVPIVIPGAPTISPAVPIVIPGAPTVIPGASVTVPGAPMAIPGASTSVPGVPVIVPGAVEVVTSVLTDPGTPETVPGTPAIVPGVKVIAPRAVEVLPAALTVPETSAVIPVVVHAVVPGMIIATVVPPNLPDDPPFLFLFLPVIPTAVARVGGAENPDASAVLALRDILLLRRRIAWKKWAKI